MISTQQALHTILHHTLLAPEELALLDEAHGKVLREPVHADRDLPPFHRVMMDGIAYKWASLPPDHTLPVADVQRAGEPRKECPQNACLEVMTGATLPRGTDTVARYEDVEFVEINGQRVAHLLAIPEKPGRHVHPQGSDKQQGDVLLAPGTVLTASEIAVAASVGHEKLAVSQPPRVGILSTGDELVDVSTVPEDYQIRRSNSYALQAALATFGIASTHYHLSDTLEATQRGIAEALAQNDVLILSGGVSKGKYDYVPEALEKVGVEKLFHRVKQRPGKPFWFGIHPQQKVVFALPGNPVSAFMCFYRYVKPWLLKSMQATEPVELRAALSKALSFAPELTYFPGVRVRTNDDGQLTATPQVGHGSGDFTNLIDCDGFLELPADRSHFAAGEVFPVHLFRPR